MPTTALQEYLFRQIRERIPASESLADAIAGLLHVSADSAYRRIRGETGLVLEEAKLLCQHYQISLDEVLGAEKNSISFQYKRIDEVYGFEQYLSGILAGLKAASEGNITYLTKDIPVFYNFLFHPLFAFRYFFWMKSIVSHPAFAHKKFSPDLLPPAIEQLGKEILLLYRHIPSTEIWNTECINSTIGQVEYYREAGYFQSETDIDAIYDSLASLIEHIRMQAECGGKFLPGEQPTAVKENYQFFFNRLVLGENTILAEAGDKLVLYLAYDVLNYMVTQDETFCRQVRCKTEMLMRRSTLLSTANDKQRNIFFNLLLKKIPFSGSHVKLAT